VFITVRTYSNKVYYRQFAVSRTTSWSSRTERLHTGIFLENEDWGVKKVMGVWNVKAEGPRSTAAGARVEAPRGLECKEKVSSSPLGEGPGEGQCPLTENFLTLDLQMVTFGAFWCFFYRSAACFTCKKLVLLGFQNLPL